MPISTPLRWNPLVQGRDENAVRKWIHPEPSLDPSENPRAPLTEAQVQSWRDSGIALVEGLVPQQLVTRARSEVSVHFPRPGSSESEGVTDFGSNGRMEFPSPSDALNEITLHGRLLGAVSQLLGVRTEDLRLTQSEAWPKYGRRVQAGGALDNHDQRVHIDYPNHSLAHPAEWDHPETVAVLAYFDRVEEVGGATEVVPRSGPQDPAYQGPLVRSPGIGGIPFVNNRDQAEAFLRESHPELAEWRKQNLYPHTRSAHFGPGTFLFYRHDVWHRGTPIKEGAMRIAHNLSFRRADCEWISTVHKGWAWSMYESNHVMEKLIAHGSVEQRCVLGFPEPGHPYWTRATLDAVRARFEFEGMDMRPYEAGLGSDRSQRNPALDQLRSENHRLRQENHRLRRRLEWSSKRG